MSVQNLALPLIMSAFVLITIAFIIKYCNFLKLAEREYEKAKGVIKTIVLSFSRNQERQNDALGGLELHMEAVRAEIERALGRLAGIEGRVQSLETHQKSSSTEFDKEFVVRFESMQQEIQAVVEDQRNIYDQLSSLEERTRTIDSDEKGAEKTVEVLRPSRLTDTEHAIIQSLLRGGAKTSSEIEKEINKTREHTARLMKKLWQEGYIERDTHRIPYIYRVTEKLKELNSELGGGVV